MRNFVFFRDVQAGVQHISEPVNFDQRVSWELFIESSGLNGVPKFFIEQASTGSKCISPTEWTVYKSRCSSDGSFDLDEALVTIEKNDFKTNWFRVRFEPNGNTEGFISARISYKTFP